VAVIIVNWNNYRDTIECLESLKTLTYNNYKVYVVDNGSTNKSTEKLTRYLETIKPTDIKVELMETNANLGFAGGNNFAIKKAISDDCDCTWLLNNDTLVESGSLDRLIDTMYSDQQIGIVGSKIYYYNTNKIWFAGGQINTWTGKATHIGYQEEDSALFSTNKEVDYITGCSMLIKREVIREIGVLPEYYFLYFEETEFNIVAKKRGWKIIYVPSSKIYHKASASTGGENSPSPLVNYYFLRNQFWFIYKTQPFYKKCTCYIYIVLKAIKRIINVMLHDQKDKSKNIASIIKAILDAVQKRKVTQKLSSIEEK
jgi:GT2 family glycosyltransferase